MLVSSGNVVLLGGLLAVVAATRAGAIAALLASMALLVRWGGPELSAIGGGQAVLGPGVLLGTPATAGGIGLTALAVALLAPRPVPMTVAVGTVAGAVAVGPALPHDVPLRLLGIAVGIAAAHVAHRVPQRHRAAAAVGALGLVLVAVG